MNIDVKFLLNEVSFLVDDILESDKYTVITLALVPPTGEDLEHNGFKYYNYQFVQNEYATKNGIGVQPFGAIFIPKDIATSLGASIVKLTLMIGDVLYVFDSDGTVPEVAVGTVLPFRINDGIA